MHNRTPVRYWVTTGQAFRGPVAIAIGAYPVAILAFILQAASSGFPTAHQPQQTGPNYL